MAEENYYERLIREGKIRPTRRAERPKKLRRDRPVRWAAMESRALADLRESERARQVRWNAQSTKEQPAPYDDLAAAERLSR